MKLIIANAYAFFVALKCVFNLSVTWHSYIYYHKCCLKFYLTIKPFVTIKPI